MPKKLVQVQERSEYPDKSVIAQAYVKLENYPAELHRDLNFEEFDKRILDYARLISDYLGDEDDDIVVSSAYRKGSLIIDVDFCGNLVELLSDIALIKMGFDVAKLSAESKAASVAKAAVRINKIFKETIRTLNGYIIMVSKVGRYERYLGKVNTEARTPALGCLVRYWDAVQVARVKGHPDQVRIDALGRAAQNADSLNRSIKNYAERRFLCDYMSKLAVHVPAKDFPTTSESEKHYAKLNRALESICKF